MQFVVPLLVSDDVYFNDWDTDIVEQLTGIKKPSKPFTTLAQGASDGRLQVVMLAKIACSIETTFGPDLLDPKPHTQTGPVVGYLEFLASCGYTLADAEQAVLGACKAHKKS